MQRNQRPHFVRTTHFSRQKDKTAHNKSRILCLILKRIVNSRLKQHISHFKKYNQTVYNTLAKAFQRVQRNIEFCKLICWKKLIFYSKIKKKEQTLLKVTFNFGKKLQYFTISEAFKKIISFGSRKIGLINKKIQSSRRKIIKNIVRAIFKQNITKGFNKIKEYTQQIKKNSTKYYLMCKCLQALIRNRQYHAWGRILSIGNAENNDLEHQLVELNKEMDVMRRQLGKKSKQILQLQSQIKSNWNQQGLYQATPKNNERRNLSLQNSRRSSRSFKSNRRNASQDAAEKKSQVGNVDNMNNFSILSWLNGSFLSIKSNKSISRSNTGVECYCKYRQSYNRYKTQATSLKNQLQIIKSQLEVTKDLNQHLQQQMSNLCLNAHNQSPQLQLLRRQVRQLRRQKQTMKDKLINNQKYIANLKCQFKVKIQNLYKNVKKTS